MSKHQTCPQCHSDFVGPDTGIGNNLCRTCDNELHSQCHDEISGLCRQLAAETERADKLQYDLTGERAASYAMLRAADALELPLRQAEAERDRARAACAAMTRAINIVLKDDIDPDSPATFCEHNRQVLCACKKQNAGQPLLDELAEAWAAGTALAHVFQQVLTLHGIVAGTPIDALRTWREAAKAANEKT